MILAICFTNLDAYKTEKWPTEFPAVPHRGDWVEAESGKTLAVVNITWVTAKGRESRPITHMRIELHRA